MIEHWNGHKWSVVPGASPGNCAVFLNGVAVRSALSASQDELLGVAVLSSSYAWAVGYQGQYKTLVERWNGTTWTVQPSPN